MNLKIKLFFVFLTTLNCIANAQILIDSLKYNNELIQYQNTQDSIRKLIINTKPRKDIINSVLQELYIKDVIDLKNDSIFFNIYLDLHNAGCTASDGFAHILSFAIADIHPFSLPNKITAIENVDTVKSTHKLKIRFELVYQSDTNFVYHSEKYKRTLVVNKNARGAYYYTTLTITEIKKYGIEKLEEKYFNNENKIPYRSTLFNGNYEFIENK